MSTGRKDLTLSEAAQIVGGELQSVIDGSLLVSAVVGSSSSCQPGCLFVALPGTKVDGHDYLDHAFRSGAVAAVVQHGEQLHMRPGIVVPDTRRAISALAAAWYNYPSNDVAVVGVTGTNGKTTIVWVAAQLLRALGRHPIELGTLGVQGAPGIVAPALTTVDPLTLHQALRVGCDAGADCAVMEVSSHSLVQSRVEDLCFKTAVFTNLTRDHLDYHGDMERYYEAKRRLFELLFDGDSSDRTAIIDIDDPYGRRLVGELQGGDRQIVTYGWNTLADVRIKSFDELATGSNLILTGPDRVERQVEVGFIGGFNASNLVAAAAVVCSMGYPWEQVVELLKIAKPAPGRLEPVGTVEFPVFVDYAHTPDALENSLMALRPITLGQLWVIFGCGGDRDRGKRALMGQVAARLADRVVITSDNPRTEDPEAIITDILEGGCEVALVEPDRGQAIATALAQIQPGDVVLVAGKGHEDYQIIGTSKHHFSDQEAVQDFFERKRETNQ